MIVVQCNFIADNVVDVQVGADAAAEFDSPVAQALFDDDDEPEFSSAMPLEEGDTFFFAPRPLRNLVLVDELESLSPILHTQVLRKNMLCFI